jgi:hypothetical protein
MFDCRGEEATHDYIVDVSEWRRSGKRNRAAAPLPKTVRLSFELAPNQLADTVDALTPFTLENP